MFQPNMIGSCESGIVETINYVLKQFTVDDQLDIASNIYVTGGCAQFAGLKERLNREIMEIRPFQTQFHVNIDTEPSLDAWISAKNFANSANFQDTVTTKSDYHEFGSEYFKENLCSNKYFPTPTVIDTTIVSSQTSVVSASETVEKNDETIFMEEEMNE